MSQGGASVLIVEDEPGLAELFRLWLGDDYEVQISTTGQGALEQLDDSTQAVLLDRHLPDISGDDVLVELRETNDIPVAFVSGVDPAGDILRLPVDVYRQKPIDREGLRSTVETLLERGAMSQQKRARLAREDKRRVLEDHGTTYTDAVSPVRKTGGREHPLKRPSESNF